MKIRNLINYLMDFDLDDEVSVSVDVSAGEEDAYNRVFGKIFELQADNMGVTILCEGEFNFDREKEIQGQCYYRRVVGKDE